MAAESSRQDGNSEIPNLSLEVVKAGTNNFSDDLLIGEGGFGKVYKANLPERETVAVKKLKVSELEVTDRQFRKEVDNLKSLGHENIVRLLYCCSESEIIPEWYKGACILAEKPERLLCFEFMPKGNLRQYLSDEFSGLDWDMRYKIIKGICFGVDYLHSVQIIHMDLKPENILLDDLMVPKITDFGLSRLFSMEKTHTITVTRKGSMGYMAPEYIDNGMISKQSDMFSLGVIILEILGDKNYPEDNGLYSLGYEQYFTRVTTNWRNRLRNEQRFTTLAINQIASCTHIGLDCVKHDRADRPKTSTILEKLRT